MKFILIVSMFCSVLWAEGFSKYQIIKKDTPIDKIIEIITKAPKGTVVSFSEGEYNFQGREIIFKSKNYLSIESIAKGKVIFSNVIIGIYDSNFIKIRNIKFVDESGIVFYRTKYCSIDKVELEETFISFYDSSSGIIENVLSEIGSKHPTIAVMGSSKVNMSNVKITNNSGPSCVYSEGSFLKINNSKFSNNTSDAIVIKNSKLHITNSDFFNIENSDVFIDGSEHANKKKKISRFIVARNESRLIAMNNMFTNNYEGIVLTRSTQSYIYQNKFSKLNLAVGIYDNSSGIIENNNIYDANMDRASGIYLKNSKADILDNDIRNVSSGITVTQDSSANIESNVLRNLARAYYLDSDGDKRYIKGFGINVQDGTQANIENTKYNSERSDCGIATYKSLVYLKNNDKGFALPGWGDPQVTNTKLNIEVEKPVDFLDVFKDIKTIDIDYENLTNINNEENIASVEKSFLKTTKGFLEEDIIITTKDGYEDEIEKGTPVVLDENKVILEPKEYEGIKLVSMPKMSVSAKNRQITLNPHTIKKNGVYLIQLSIKSNVKIEEILFKSKSMYFESVDAQTYQTTPRRIKRKYIGKTYPLHIKGKDFTEVYACKVNSLTEVVCSKKKKLEVK